MVAGPGVIGGEGDGNPPALGAGDTAFDSPVPDVWAVRHRVCGAARQAAAGALLPGGRLPSSAAYRVAYGPNVGDRRVERRVSCSQGRWVSVSLAPDDPRPGDHVGAPDPGSRMPSTVELPTTVAAGRGRGLAGATGVEPATTGFGNRRSSGLSYTPVCCLRLRCETQPCPGLPGAASTSDRCGLRMPPARVRPLGLGVVAGQVDGAHEPGHAQATAHLVRLRGLPQCHGSNPLHRVRSTVGRFSTVRQRVYDVEVFQDGQSPTVRTIRCQLAERHDTQVPVEARPVTVQPGLSRATGMRWPPLESWAGSGHDRVHCLRHDRTPAWSSLVMTPGSARPAAEADIPAAAWPGWSASSRIQVDSCLVAVLGRTIDGCWSCCPYRTAIST